MQSVAVQTCIISKMAAGEALALLSKGNGKVSITFEGPANSHIVSKEKRWVYIFRTS